LGSIKLQDSHGNDGAVATFPPGSEDKRLVHPGGELHKLSDMKMPTCLCVKGSVVVR